MPELPEVETTRRGIASSVVGRGVTAIAIRNARLRWPVPKSLPRLLIGRRLQQLQRRAKYLLFEFEHGTLIVHLGMSGSLRLVSPDTQLRSHDHFDLVFESSVVLRFNDPRRFGCVLWTEGQIADHRLLKRLGPEPLSEEFTAGYLQQAAGRRKVAIKQLLMNAQVVVGVGNIYASEALFRAGIRPQRAAGRITRAEFERLVPAIKAVLEDAIRCGGTTLRDYINPEGLPGYFRQQLFVYERDGQPCRVCATHVRRLVQGQRSTYYCPTCQR